MRSTKKKLTSRTHWYLYIVSLFNVFLILLIFIVFLPQMMSPQGLSIALPRVLTSESVSQKGFSISILKDNSIYLGLRKVSIEELMDFLHSQKDFKNRVLIKVDQQANVGVLVKVWDLLRESGAAKVSIATNE